MQVGDVVRNSGLAAIDGVRQLPAAAQDLGFASIWLTDHVVGQRAFTVYEPEWAEILVALGHAAATTSTIRLGTGVLVVPYRDPVLTAKMLSTIDNLSDGRLVVGIGAGWARGEFAALGRAEFFDRRGEIVDESLKIMLRCWQGGEFSWEGDRFAFGRMTFEPTPAQRPRPPIWVGGQSKAALRRAARIADAWHPTNISPDEVATLGARLDELAGRTVPRTIRLRIDESDLDGAPELLARYEHAGCVEAAVQISQPRYSVDSQLSAMRRLAATVGLSRP